MPIDFQLSPSEKRVRDGAATFAATVLKDARKDYLQYTQHHERFQSTRPIYRKAVEAGLVKGQVPAPLGGTGGALIESAILVEEFYSVEPSASLTIFATGLGLTPLILAGKPEHRTFFDPFLSGEGEPLASLVFSEPGGVANYLEIGAPGLNTTAQEEDGEWVINGEKVLISTPSSRYKIRSADSNLRYGVRTAVAGTFVALTFNAWFVARQLRPRVSRQMRSWLLW